MTKEQILNALHAFIRQRPGLEFGNYGDTSSYRREMRSITTDRHHAEALLGSVARKADITAENIIRASEHAFSGRLTIRENDKGQCVIDYCAGQYFPTEYRRAVCAVMASTLWDYWREHCMPEGETVHNSETGETFKRYRGQSAGDYLRGCARREFDRAIARRWFA